MEAVMHKAAGFVLVVLLLSLADVRSQQKTIDEIIVDAANSTRQFDYFSTEPMGYIKVELDMLYTPEEWEELQRLNGSGSAHAKRTAGILDGTDGYRWTKKEVPYELAYGTFSSYDEAEIEKALADWSGYTCVRFRRSTSRDQNKIKFQNGGGCASRVGMVGGEQAVILAPGCRTKGVIIHEVGHALGLHHEQTRPDRDQYVRVLKENIPDHLYYNFEKYTWNVIMNMGIPYDYYSIMHYGKTAFTHNGRLTIQTVDPKYQDIIGNRQELSFGDVKSMNIMYNCKRDTQGCTKNDGDCPGEGFVGKDCQCWCPGDPVKLCSDDGGDTGGNNKKCEDMHNMCSQWAKLGECDKNPSYMHDYCKKSCKKCNGGEEETCKDLHENCPFWATYGYCTGDYMLYMTTNCKKSCKICEGGEASTTVAPATTTAATFCSDNNGNCPYWAQGNYCKLRPDYMLVHCRKSCGVCSTSSEGANCKDKNSGCGSWAEAGLCSEDPSSYMFQNCKKSCDQC